MADLRMRARQGDTLRSLDAARFVVERCLHSEAVKVWNALSSKRRRRLAQLPQGIRVYAVGDVHGRADLLAQLLAQIDADLEAHPAPRAMHVFLGDYIDRGPDSRGVLDLLIARGRRHEAIFLKG